jgi:hypothetical protein
MVLLVTNCKKFHTGGAFFALDTRLLSFSNHCDKIPDRNNFREEGLVLGPWEGSAHGCLAIGDCIEHPGSQSMQPRSFVQDRNQKKVVFFYKAIFNHRHIFFKRLFNQQLCFFNISHSPRVFLLLGSSCPDLLFSSSSSKTIHPNPINKEAQENAL